MEQVRFEAPHRRNVYCMELKITRGDPDVHRIIPSNARD
jgi:hypothetical protein